MPRQDIVGTPQIAAKLGVKPATVSQWRARFSDFPEPLLHLGWQAVWDWQDVQEWAEKHDRT